MIFDYPEADQARARVQAKYQRDLRLPKFHTLLAVIQGGLVVGGFFATGDPENLVHLAVTLLLATLALTSYSQARSDRAWALLNISTVELFQGLLDIRNKKDAS